MITTSTAIITVLLIIMIFIVPRRLFLLPYILAVCFVPADQRVIILTLDFTVFRMLVLAGLCRILLRGEQAIIKWSRFDKLVLAWAVCGAVVYVVQWADARAIVYKCGVLLDILGSYWLFRQSIRSYTDIKYVFQILAMCALIMMPFVVWERATGSNPFSRLGTVQTVLRESEYRCQGPFSHSIMLGLFWATLVPVFVSFAKGKQSKHLFWGVAAAASIIMTFLTVSSTPLLTLIVVILLLLLFPYRRHGRQIAWAACGLTVALHMVMQAPVWHLISRVNVIGGSTGWHRFNLIDKTIRHFGEWILFGTRSTEHWGTGLTDITNQYCLEAVQGGLVTIVIFVFLLVMAIRVIGSWSLTNMSAEHQWFAWGLCVCLLGHCISFLGVSYFGQIKVLLYLTLALVGFVAEKLQSPLLVTQERSRLIGAV